MPRGLNRLTNAANKIEAWRDWDKQAARALALGRKDLVDNFHPPDGAGWRKIDGLMSKLRSHLDLLEEAITGAPDCSPWKTTSFN